MGTTERLHFHFSLSCIGEGNGNPLQCSCLGNPKGGEVWWAAVYGVPQSQTQLKRLSSSSNVYIYIYESEVKMSRSVVSDPLQPHGLYSPWNSPGKNTGVGSLSLLQEVFPTQGSNPGLPHCRQILYQLSHKGSPIYIYIYLYIYTHTNTHSLLYPFACQWIFRLLP